MKKIKNYRSIRTQPLIFGFSFQSAIIFAIVVLFTMSLFITGFTTYKTILACVIIFIAFIVCKYILGEENVFERLFDQKFPNELNDFTNERRKYK